MSTSNGYLSWDDEYLFHKRQEIKCHSFKHEDSLNDNSVKIVSFYQKDSCLIIDSCLSAAVLKAAE